MPIIQPDTSEIQGALEPSTYEAEIVAAEPGIASSGNPKLVVKFSLDVSGKKVPRTVHMPTSGKGAFGFDSLLRTSPPSVE